ncbi:MAG: hypothetical protein HYX75_01395 [Acidobacteria bacterium]|nr:hypothetical protein [Acidobacteriota bacterium]
MRSISFVDALPLCCVILSVSLAPSWEIDRDRSTPWVPEEQGIGISGVEARIDYHNALAEPTVTWAKAYGGNAGDDISCVRQTSDGGYIVVGETSSFGVGGIDVWVVKLDGSGNVVWQKTYGTTSDDYVYWALELAAGGYMVAANTGGDVWVLRLRSDSSILWQRRVGGWKGDWAYSLRQTRDGGYILAGGSWSFGAGKADFWVVKLSPSGSVVWQKAYGGEAYDQALSVELSLDGGYIVVGMTRSFGAGGWDGWILKLDSFGNVAWQRSLGGREDDALYSVAPSTDGGCIVAGRSRSFTANRHWTLWLTRLGPTGNVVWQRAYGGKAGVVDVSIAQSRQADYLVATWLSGAGPRVLRLGDTGAIKWQKRYFGSIYATSFIAQTRDDGYVVGVDAYPDQSEDFGLLKLAPDGTMASSCSWLPQNTDMASWAIKASVASTACRVISTTATVMTTGAGAVNSGATTTDLCASSPAETFPGHGRPKWPRPRSHRDPAVLLLRQGAATS